MSYNINIKTKKQDNSRVLFVIIIGFFILALMVNFVKLTREYFLKKQILEQSQAEYSKALDQQNKLKLSIKKNQTQEYIEKKARELTMSKPGEVVVILSSPAPVKKKSSSAPKKTANYKLWLQLFFK